MTRQTRALAALAASAALSGWAFSALAQDPARDPAPQPPPRAGERIGETVDRAAGAIRNGVRETAEGLREQFGRAKTSVRAMGVQARVYSRIHWDKALGQADLDIDMNRDGVATLKGAVPDARAKARAVELARETVGVTSVVDQLTIGPPRSTTTTTTKTTTETTTTPASTRPPSP